MCETNEFFSIFRRISTKKFHCGRSSGYYRPPPTGYVIKSWNYEPYHVHRWVSPSLLWEYKWNIIQSHTPCFNQEEGSNMTVFLQNYSFRIRRRRNDVFHSAERDSLLFQCDFESYTNLVLCNCRDILGVRRLSWHFIVRRSRCITKLWRL